MKLERKWLLCFCAYLVQFMVFGFHNNYGLIYHVFLEEFNGSAAETAWIGSFCMGLVFSVSPLVTLGIHYLGLHLMMGFAVLLSMISFIASSLVYSIHLLPFTYSVLFGVGSGIANVASLSILQEYFDSKQISLACGIAISGTGVGTLVLAPLLNFLITRYGFRWAFKMVAMFFLIYLFPVICYRQRSQTSDKNKDIELKTFSSNEVQTNIESASMARKKARCFDKDIWCVRPFQVFLLGISAFFLFYCMPFIFLVDHATANGFQTREAQYLIGLLAIIGTVFKIISGLLISYVKCIDRMTLFLTAMLLVAVSHMIAARAEHKWQFYLFVVLFGMSEGVITGQIVAVVTDLIPNKEKVSKALGVIFAVMSVPIMAGPFIAGKLSGITRSYVIPFYAATATTLLSFLITMTTKFCIKKKSLMIDQPNAVLDSSEQLLLVTGSYNETPLFKRSLAYRQ